MNRSLGDATIVIVGMGLMGGSLAMALAGRAARLVGIDADPSVVQTARKRRIVDAAARINDCRSWFRRADLLVLATPIGQMGKILRDRGAHLKPGVVVTDLGGAKAQVETEITSMLPSGVQYIPGHPMAGSEKRGISGAEPGLYQGATWVVGEEPPDILREAIAAVGAEIMVLDADLHDRAVAYTSHLPHLMAAVTADVCGEAARGEVDLFRSLAAGGFSDTTRICEGSTEMGADMCIYNAGQLLPAIERARQGLEELASALRGRDRRRIRGGLRRARAGRQRIVGDAK